MALVCVLPISWLFVAGSTERGASAAADNHRLQQQTGDRTQRVSRGRRTRSHALFAHVQHVFCQSHVPDVAATVHSDSTDFSAKVVFKCTMPHNAVKQTALIEIVERQSA